jgi:hypothetical protein
MQANRTNSFIANEMGENNLSVCYNEERFGDPGEFATHPRNEKIGLESGIFEYMRNY